MLNPEIMNETYNIKIQKKKIEELHCESKIWKSNLYLVQDEILFIDRLLNSYVFEPNTPNLFERLQGFLLYLKKANDNKSKLLKHVENHENDLGGMLECTNETGDLNYYQKHNFIRAEVTDFLEKFKDLKSEVFNYAGGILKKRRPAN